MRRFFCLGMMALLAACGFEPMYGSGVPSSDASASPAPDAATPALRETLASIAVSVSPPAAEQRRLAQLLRARIEDRLNPAGGGAPSSPEYYLYVNYSLTETPAAISRDGTVARYNLIFNAELTLVRASDGVRVYKGLAQRTGSYDNLINAYYSTYVAVEDARRRTVEELAEDIRLRLAAVFASPLPQAPLPVSGDRAMPTPTAPLPFAPLPPAP